MECGWSASAEAFQQGRTGSILTRCELRNYVKNKDIIGNSNRPLCYPLPPIGDFDSYRQTLLSHHPRELSRSAVDKPELGEKRMKNMKQLFTNLMVEESGQDLIEYALVAALVGLGAVAAMKGL
jgi:hypothetical protein